MRTNHFIKANHHTELPLRMIWVDTEAVNENGEIGAGIQRLTFGVALYERYASKAAKRPCESDSLRFDTAVEFWQWVQKKTSPKTTTWIMAHNWNYDAGILNTSELLPALGYDLAKYINAKPPLIVNWKYPKTAEVGGHTVKMVDTLNYFSGSVASLGESVGMPKLKMPAASAGLGEWDSYAWRDVEIIRLAFLGFREFVRDQDLGVMQATLASQAMNAYRHRFMPVNILCHVHASGLALERAAFHGGRTEAFWRGQVEGPLYKLDVNSHYPAVMAQEKLGYHFESYFPSFNQGWWNKARREDRAIVAEVLIDTDEPVYGVVYEGKLVFPVGCFWATLTTPEIDYAEANGHIRDVGAFAVHRRAVLFEGFISHFYNLRQGFKTAGNATMNYMTKLILNSLFGKMGQNGRKWNMTEDYDWPLNWSISSEGYIGDPDGEPVKLRYRLGQVQALSTSGESENSVPMIAAEITAYGRVRLWELIKKAGVENVFYVDTDSLITNEVGYRNLAGKIHESKLGGLKLEEVLEHGKFYAPKDYQLWAGVPWMPSETIKGVRSRAIKLGEGQYQQETFRSWDANLKAGVDGSITVTTTVKNLQRRNTKRVVIAEDSVTEPIEIQQAALVYERELMAIKLDEAAGNLEAHLFKRAPAPWFGTTERAEFDAERRGVISKSVQVKAARVLLRGLKKELKALDSKLECLTEGFEVA